MLENERVRHLPRTPPSANELVCKLHRCRPSVKESRHNHLDNGIFLSIPSVRRDRYLVHSAVEVLGLEVTVHYGDGGG